MEQKWKNKYDNKIETVKYLVRFYQKSQNKSWLIFNNASKVYKLPGLVYSHSIVKSIFLKLKIRTVQKIKCCYLNFEQNCYLIGWGDTRPLKSVAKILNHTVVLCP